MKDLYQSRNSKNFFKKYGTLGGLFFTGVSMYFPFLNKINTKNSDLDSKFDLKEKHVEV